MLRWTDLQIGYDGRRLLNAANAELEPGKLIALMGANGSGKSSLLRCLAGRQAPLAGKIEWKLQGQWMDQQQADSGQKAAFCASVWTKAIDFGQFRIEEFLRLSRNPYLPWYREPGEEENALVEQSMQRCQLTKYRGRYCQSLSDGERQRLMLAACLVQQSPLILLDEATAFLDLRHSRLLFQLLQELAHSEQKLILLSSHQAADCFRFADDILLIEKQKLLPWPKEEWNEDRLRKTEEEED